MRAARLWACLGWLLAPGATLAAQEPAAPVAIEELEEIEVAAVEVADPGAREVVGRLHPALVHLPIAWLLLWLLVEILVVGLGRERLVACRLGLGALTVGSFLPASLSGFLRAAELEALGASPAPLEGHRLWMLVAAGLALACLGARLLGRRGGRRALEPAVLAGLALAAAALAWGAHLGGRMVHGEGYLPF